MQFRSKYVTDNDGVRELLVAGHPVYVDVQQSTQYGKTTGWCRIIKHLIFIACNVSAVPVKNKLISNVLKVFTKSKIITDKNVN